MPPIGGWNTGVYAIKHLGSGKLYVGGAYKSFGDRFRIHRRDLHSSRHGNNHLLNAWKKYGESAFRFVILEKCSPKLCEAREQYWISKLNATDREFGYNKSPTAGSPLGTKHPPEYGAAVSARNRLRNNDPNKRKKVLVAIANARSYMTEETYRKIGLALKGRKRPPDVVTKIALALKGKKRQPDALARIAAANKARKLTPELREKIGRGNRGRKQSPEEIARRSASIRLAWKLKKEKQLCH